MMIFRTNSDVIKFIQIKLKKSYPAKRACKVVKVSLIFTSFNINVDTDIVTEQYNIHFYEIICPVFTSDTLIALVPCIHGTTKTTNA